MDTNIFFCGDCGSLVMIAGNRLEDHVGCVVTCTYCRGVSMITEESVVSISSLFGRANSLIKHMQERVVARV